MLRRRFPALVGIAMGMVLGLVLPSSTAAQQAEGTVPAAIELPPELERVLRDYERGWSNRDAAALAALFHEDGFVLRPGQPPARGRAAIERAYGNSGGPLSLRAYEYQEAGGVGYIIGGFSTAPDRPAVGKFVLAIRQDASGRWLIAADIDNGN